MEETHVIQSESVKISQGMTGKRSIEFKLLGKPEDNKDRVEQLLRDFNAIIEVKSTE